MRDYLIFSIFLFCVKRKKTTAKEISKEFDISVRSVYRYIDNLSLLGVPIITKLGKGGGIELVGEVYLENICLNKSDKEKLKQFLIDEKLTQEIKTIINKII